MGMTIPGLGLLPNLVEQTTTSTPPNSTTKSLAANKTTSLLDKLNKLYTSPRFKALNEQQKEEVKGVAYDKIVAPWYKKVNPDNVPSKEDWLKQAKTKTSFSEKDFSFPVAVTKGATGLVKGAVNIAEVFNKVQTLGLVPTKGYDAITGKLDKVEQRADEYLGDHYVNSFAHKATVFAGEQFGQLPAYIVGEGVAAEAMRLTGLAAKTYPIIYKGIKNAAVGYVSSVMLGQSQKEAAGSAATFAGFAPLEVLGSKGLAASKSFIGRLLGIGGPKALQGVLERANQAVEDGFKKSLEEGKALLSTDPIAQAGIQLLDTHSNELFSKEYAALSKANKLKVIEHIVGTAKQIEPNAAAFNKDLVTADVNNGIAEQTKKNPVFAQNVEAAKKLGIDIIQPNVEDAVAVANAKVGRNPIAKTVERLASKTPTKDAEKTKAWIDYLNENFKVGPGAASIHDPGFTRNLLNYVKGNFKLESIDHQFIQLWSVRSEFPKPIQQVIKHMMENKYPPSKGFTTADYNKMVVNLEKHLADVATAVREKTEGGVKHGAKVFASTKLEPGAKPTRWTQQLRDEVEEARIEKGIKSKHGRAAATRVKKVLRSHDLEEGDE